MDHRKRKHNKEQSSIDEFPEDFDDVYFYNHALERDKRIGVLRNIVYKQLKNSIIERVAGYKDNEFEVCDKYEVEFNFNNVNTNSFNLFQWGVVREELQERGFDARFVFENETPIKMIVPIERSIDLKQTLDERLKQDSQL